jgi:nucleoside-diphosphate-sugar epimerase
LKATVVTGAAGFVGSHLVDRLVAEGRHVVAVDNLLTGRLENLARPISRGQVSFIYADLGQNLGTLARLVADANVTEVDEVYHLASPASPEVYSSHPWDTLAVNSIGTFETIELALAHSAKYLFASTSEIYGDPLEHPQGETYFGNVNPTGARACYDEGKRFGEAAVSVAVQKRGLRGTIARLFNCYGPRMELEDGRLIPALLLAAREQQPLPIHGGGKQTRSMTYVDDIVTGLLRVARASQHDDAVYPVNLGSEDERTVLEIARAFATIANVPFELEYLPSRPEDPQRRRPRIDRARALGWGPTTQLEDGLYATLCWFTTEAVSA